MIEDLKKELMALIEERGFPAELGLLMAEQLSGEKAITRMIGYLRHTGPQRAEDLVDEMLAICEDRDSWIRKKSAEFYQEKYNSYLWDLKGDSGDEE